MKWLKNFYYLVKGWTHRSEEKGLPSAGYWQSKVRDTALRLCGSSRGRLLEIGCGEGLFLSEIASRQPSLEIFGVDRSEKHLDLARRTFQRKKIARGRIVNADANHLPFDDAFFETIVSINFLMCLPSLEAARCVLTEAARVLAPGGRLIVEFRNRRNLLLRLKYGLAKYYDGTLRDNPLTLYDPSAVMRMLGELGLEVTGQIYLDFFIKRYAPIIFFEAKKNA